MKKTMLFFLSFCSFLYLGGDIYRVKIEKEDLQSRKIISLIDIVGSGVDKDGNFLYTVNSSESEIAQLPLFAEITRLSGSMQVTPEYSDYNEINGRIDSVAERSKGIAEVFVIGHSVEGKEIKAIRISKTNDKEKDFPEILLVGTHHAREWISYEVPLSIAEFFIENVNSNDYVSEILDKSVIWFVPMLNPDGYVFSWESERYWRNNRRVNPDSTIGVDLNRNYDSSWMQVDFVHGTGPFSEPETVAIKQLIENSFSEPLENGIRSLDGLITYHSYGQMILYPPGSTLDHAEKSEYYKELAQKMADLNFSECGSIYLVMQTAELYFTFGEMTEWFMQTQKGNPSFTIELRPHMNGVDDFVLPAEHIRDTVKENITPAVYLIEHIISGEVNINMDKNNNGINDVMENTAFDYKCDRSDLELPDYGDYSDSDNAVEKPDEDAGGEDVQTDSADISENNDVDLFTSASKKSSGCNLSLVGD